MLILSRKVGEAIVIDDNTVIRLLEIKSGQVKLGIEAPSDVTIHREEVCAKIIEANKKAAASHALEDLSLLSHIVQESPHDR